MILIILKKKSKQKKNHECSKNINPQMMIIPMVLMKNIFKPGIVHQVNY